MTFQIRPTRTHTHTHSKNIKQHQKQSSVARHLLLRIEFDDFGFVSLEVKKTEAEAENIQTKRSFRVDRKEIPSNSKYIFHRKKMHFSLDIYTQTN